METFTVQEFCATLDFLNTFACFEGKTVKNFQEFCDGWHLKQILIQHDADYFDPIFSQKGFKDDFVETAGDQKHNLKIVVDALVNYYNDKMDIDLKS